MRFSLQTQKVGRPTLRILLTPFLVTSAAALLSLGLTYCSNPSVGSGSDQVNVNQKPLQIPVSMQYIPPTQSSNLETGTSSKGGSLGLDDLDLLTTGTALKVYIDGCASGYTVGTANAPVAITSTVALYNGDFTCLVKLASFTAFGSTYTAVATDATNFTAWTAGSVATFSNGGGSPPADQIKVYVNVQVSSPVTTLSTVVYNFTDITAGTADSVAEGSVSTAVPLSAVGKAAPNYTVAYSRYNSTDSTGFGNMSFTLMCGADVTGTSPNFSCPNPSDAVQSADVQHTEIHYNLVPDAYSACKTIPTTLTIANANAIFASAPTGTATQTPPLTLSATSGGGLTDTNSGQIDTLANGGADNYANASTHGGFDTPLMPTGNVPIYSVIDATYANGYSSLNDILIIQRTDGTNTLSYLYFCVAIANITQS